MQGGIWRQSEIRANQLWCCRRCPSSVLHLYHWRAAERAEQIVTNVLCSGSLSRQRWPQRERWDFHLACLVLISLSYDSLITRELNVQAINKWPRNIVAERVNSLFWMRSWDYTAARQTAHFNSLPWSKELSIKTTFVRQTSVNEREV